MLAFLAAAIACVQWSRFRGRVKAVDMAARTVTLLNSEGDLILVPITDDVLLVQGKKELTLKDLALNDKITLLHVPREHLRDDVPAGMPEPTQKGE